MPSRKAPSGALPLRRLRLRTNALTLTASNLTYFAVIFALTPTMVRKLGPDGWGIWQLVGAMPAYAALLNLGLGTAIHYQASYQSARGDFERLATALTNVRLYLWSAAAGIALLLGFAGRPLIESLVSPRDAPLAFQALAITVGMTALALPIQFFPSVLAGLQRYGLLASFQAGGAFLVLGGVLVGFRLGMGLRGLAFCMTLGTALTALLSWIAARRILPPECFRLGRFDFAYFRQMLLYSLSTMLFTGGAVVLYHSMKFIASWRCGGVEAAGEMGLSLNIVQTLSVVFTPLLGVLLSRVGQLQGEGREGEVPLLLEHALAVTGLLVVPSVVFLSVAADSIFQAWVGRAVGADVVSRLAATTRTMLLGQGAYILALPCYYTLLGFGEHRIFGVAMLVAGAVNVLAGWIFAGWSPRIETLGMVFGFTMLGLAATLGARVAHRRFGLAIAPLLAWSVVVPLVAATPGAAAVRWRPRLGDPLLDVAVDTVAFSVLTAPGIALAYLLYGRARARLGRAKEHGN